MSSSSSCGDVAAEFAVAAQKVLDGIDHITDSPNGWACVQEGSDAAGRNNTGVLVKVTDGDPDCVEVEVADSTKAEASLGSSFSEGDNEFIEIIIKGKQSTESTNPDDSPTGVTLKIKNKDTDEVLADNCKIMVLPLRSLDVAIYVVTDSNSSGTSPVNSPSDSSFMDELKLYLRQGAISFSLGVSKNLSSVDWDGANGGTKNGKMDDTEDQYLLDEYNNWEEQIRALWLKDTTMTYGDCTSDLLAGQSTTDGQTKLGFIFVDVVDARGLSKTLGMAHEFGHLMGMWDHFSGSSPSGTNALMKRSIDSQCNTEEIGEWIPKDGWQTVNATVANWPN